MRSMACAAVVILAAVGSSACDGNTRGAEAPPAAASSALEITQSAPAQQAGHFLLRPLTAQCRITSITGTHAEFMPTNPLCVVRVRVTSNDTSFHTFQTAPQRLVLANGIQVAPSYDAMSIKRQPKETQLGAGNSYEVDLWFSPPSGSPPTGLKALGDLDPDEPGSAQNPARNPAGVILPLNGLSPS